MHCDKQWRIEQIVSSSSSLAPAVLEAAYRLLHALSFAQGATLARTEAVERAKKKLLKMLATATDQSVGAGGGSGAGGGKKRKHGNEQKDGRGKAEESEAPSGPSE